MATIDLVTLLVISPITLVIMTSHLLANLDFLLSVAGTSTIVSFATTTLLVGTATVAIISGKERLETLSSSSSTSKF